MRLLLGCCMVVAVALTAQGQGKAVALFDGKTFTGWEGDTAKTWRIQDGAIVGGSLAEEGAAQRIPHHYSQLRQLRAALEVQARGQRRLHQCRRPVPQ